MLMASPGSLPRRPSKRSAPTEPMPRRPAIAPPPSERAAAARRRVLIVGERRSETGALKAAFEAEGAIVVVRSTLEEARLELRGWSFSQALIDARWERELARDLAPSARWHRFFVTDAKAAGPDRRPLPFTTADVREILAAE